MGTGIGTLMPTKGGADEEAVLRTRHLEVAAVDDQSGAFLDAFGDVALDPGLVLGGEQRTHVGLGVHAVADAQAVDARQQLLDQRVGGLLEVGVGHHDHVVLGAAPFKVLHFPMGDSSGSEVDSASERIYSRCFRFCQ
jgi:hypothetical protein